MGITFSKHNALEGNENVPLATCTHSPRRIQSGGERLRGGTASPTRIGHHLQVNLRCREAQSESSAIALRGYGCRPLRAELTSGPFVVGAVVQ
jgi:hypothetical protein